MTDIKALDHFLKVLMIRGGHDAASFAAESVATLGTRVAYPEAMELFEESDREGIKEKIKREAIYSLAAGLEKYGALEINETTEGLEITLCFLKAAEKAAEH